MQVSTRNGVVSFTDGDFQFNVTFHRTIRLPEDGKTHALPPSLGIFPVHLVDDFKDKVPADWVEHGGVFLPMHQREALWLGFSGSVGAVKVATGKINAVSGKPWDPALEAGRADIQDYMVAPAPQLWIDGFNSGSGVIKQFVGMALGQGYTVEGQVTGKEKFGGIQILVIPPKEEHKPRIVKPHTYSNFCQMGEIKTSGLYATSFCFSSSSLGSPSRPVSLRSAQIGLAAGGSMKQKIYPDPYGVGTWDQQKSGRVYVHIINAEMYAEITGKQPPVMPESAQSYSGTWYDLADESAGDVAASETLTGVKTVAEKDKEHGFEGQQDDSPIDESGKVHTYTHSVPAGSAKVRNGDW